MWKYSTWFNQHISQRDCELSCLGYFVSIKTVIKLSILCNLIILPTYTALPLSTNPPQAFSHGLSLNLFFPCLCIL